MLYGIVAAAKHPDGSYVIGNGATMPWHLPGELKWFRQQTLGKPIIMGRKTFEGLPNGPLKGRENIVLTSQKDWSYPGVKAVHDPDEIVRRYGKSKDPAFIAGGAEIYRHFMPHTSGLVFTTIHHPYEGSVKFPLTHDELMSQFEETEKYPDMSDNNIVWSRSVLHRKSAKSMNVYNIVQRLSKAVSRQANEDEWSPNRLGKISESIIPQIMKTAYSMKSERMPFSSAFSKDGLIKIKPGFGYLLYKYLKNKGGGFSFSHGKKQWNDFYQQHAGEFIDGDVHDSVDQPHNLEALNPGEEFSIASGGMSFRTPQIPGDQAPRPSVIRKGDPWEFVAIGSNDGRPQFGIRLPFQSHELHSLDEAPDWMPGSMTSGVARSRFIKHIRDILAKSDMFDRKTGVAHLSRQDAEILSSLLQTAQKSGDPKLHTFSPKGGDGTYLSLPNSSRSGAFTYTPDEDSAKTHVQLFLRKDGSARLYDIARDPRAFVHKGADGSIGTVLETGGNKRIHVDGMLGNIGVPGEYEFPQGQASPNIKIHPDTREMRDRLARHLFETPDSPHGEFVVSHAGTGVHITPYTPPTIGRRTGSEIAFTPERQANIQQMLDRARAQVAERNAGRTAPEIAPATAPELRPSSRRRGSRVPSSLPASGTRGNGSQSVGEILQQIRGNIEPTNKSMLFVPYLIFVRNT